MKERVLILGATGMLGSTLLRVLIQSTQFEIFGTVRNENSKKRFSDSLQEKIFENIHADEISKIITLLEFIKPSIVINCIGIIKQLKEANDAIKMISVNSLFPHQLAKMTSQMNARLIHFSTDCVFSGKKGMYVETDFADAYDLYGKTKLLGEVDYSNCLTIRTSIIGHGLVKNTSLVDWFLSREETVFGFKNAIFSGFPTVELSQIIKNYVIDNKGLSGIYHVSANPINKFDLLNLIAKKYQKKTNIVSKEDFIIDRSLDSTKFRNNTGFAPKTWSKLIDDMYEFENEQRNNN